MTSRVRIVSIFVAAAIILLAGSTVGRPMMKGQPILLRLIDPSEVAPDPMVIIMNPLRNKEPERVAESLLTDLRDRNLDKAFVAMGESAEENIRENEMEYPISGWRLVNRKDGNQTVVVVYAISRETSPPVKTFTTIRLKKTGALWEIASFEPIY